jgi:ABC-type transport system involved in cytochrome bd biosynthesis fused ATPase/permease subunit
MIKKINLSGYLKKKNIRNNIYLGNKKNSKATIDQKKKKKKEIVKERKNNH